MITGTEPDAGRWPVPLRALASRDFALYLASKSISHVGTWMQRVAQDWVVLHLTHGSGPWLGVTVAAQYAPTLVLGLHAGAWVDRLPVRAAMLAEQVVTGILALALAVLSATGVLAVWNVVALAVLLGVCTVISNPLQQALFAQVVPRTARSSAIALNSGVFTTGRVIGAALAGPMISLAGVTAAFAFNAATYLIVLVALTRIRPHPATGPGRATREPGQIREGLAYVAARPDLQLVMAVTLMASIAAMPFATTLVPLMATTMLDAGATGLGLAGAAVALGAVAGQIEAARHTPPRPAGVVFRVVALGALLTLTGLATGLWILMLVVIPVAAAGFGWQVLAQSVLHEQVEPSLLGRVTSVWFLAASGANAIGPPLVGVLASVAGTRAAFTVCGA